MNSSMCNETGFLRNLDRKIWFLNGLFYFLKQSDSHKRIHILDVCI